MKFLFKRWLDSFFDEPANEKVTNEEEVVLATCALFLEMAHIDDEFSESEQETLMTILKEDYQLSEARAKAMLDTAETQRKESLDMWTFTKKINDYFSKEEKINIVERLWKIVFADGKLEGHEDYLVHTLANMLHLGHDELIAAKLKVKDGGKS